MKVQSLSIFLFCLIGFNSVWAYDRPVIAQSALEDRPSEEIIQELEKISSEGARLYEQGLYEEAIAKTLEELENVATEGANLYQQGHYEEAIPLLLEFVSISETLVGENDPLVATGLNGLAQTYRDQIFRDGRGDYTAAISSYERAISIYENTSGETHTGLVDSLEGLAKVYEFKLDYAAAAALYERTLDIKEAALGDSHIDVAFTLNILAETYRKQANYDSALPLYERALVIREEALGLEHPDVATVLNNIGLLYKNISNYAAAIPPLERAVSIREAAQGLEHPDLAANLVNLASVYRATDEYPKALPLLERALAIEEKVFGRNHRSVATTLNELGLLYSRQANYAAALPLQEQAVAILKSTQGENHPSVATALSNLAISHYMRGEHTTAQSLLEDSLSIFGRALGENHPSFADSLSKLAFLTHAQGDYVSSQAMYERAISIQETAMGESHPNVAANLRLLGAVHVDQGNYDAAQVAYERALKIQEATLGESSTTVANTLNGLGLLHAQNENYVASIPLLERALSIYESVLGENHHNVSDSLSHLADAYFYQGDYTVALPLYERSLSIREEAFGETHADVADSLNDIGLLYAGQNDHATALPLFERSLAIYESIFKEDHPFLAVALVNIAISSWAQNNLEKTLEAFKRASSIQEDTLEEVLTSSSESGRQTYINNSVHTRGINSIAFNIRSAPDSVEATQLAFTNILRRKGRILDAVTNQQQRLRAQLSPDDQALLDELGTIRSQIAALQFNGLSNQNVEQYQSELGRLGGKAESIEVRLARSSARFELEITPVTIDTIKPLIPENAALVEFVRYLPINPTAPVDDRYGKGRYAAYVLNREGQTQVVDLGEAKAIEQLIGDFQQALSTRSASVKQIARQLDEYVMAPIRPLLGSKTHLLISPDGQLSLIPFDALIGEQDNYLIQDYQISYLTSGRDLVKFQLDTPSKQTPVILANPSYGELAASSVSVASSENVNKRSVDANNLNFGPLPGTIQESEAIASFLPNATVFTEDQATESHLKQVEAPSILHIATHGFFLPDVEFIPSVASNSRSALGASLNVVTTDTPASVTPSNLENPLLRSGLAFAGANIRSSGDDDGIFTALEASGLNLYGTQLVVLSACETGVGSISNGEGVYGLRRAFVAAGAESQLMSLWQVDDYGTSELMQLFYQNLMEKGQGRSEALRSAQLEMMNTGTYAHPYYWSSFIFSGDWRPLEAQN